MRSLSDSAEKPDPSFKKSTKAIDSAAWRKESNQLDSIQFRRTSHPFISVLFQPVSASIPHGQPAQRVGMTLSISS